VSSCGAAGTTKNTKKNQKSLNLRKIRNPIPASCSGFVFFVFFVVPCAVRVVAAGCDDEIERAQATAAIIERDWPLRGADEVTAFVRAVGARLALHAPASTETWTFAVVRDRTANAFAVGNGRIYVTDGAVEAATTEAELAAMVAHEMGHQLAQHFCANGPRAGRRKRIGSLVQHIDPAKEREADRRAVQVLTAAGYDPHAALTAAIHLGRARPDDARVRGLSQLLATVPSSGRTDSEEFRRLKATTKNTK
jgi:hypothetical protein